MRKTCPTFETDLVSIITPIFNGEQWILEAAETVIQQDYVNWEWIIINDGSTDRTSDLLATLNDPRIKIIFQSNGGVSSARNAGLNNIKGEYVTFLDADDLLTASSLKLRVEFLRAHPEVDIVNGGVLVTIKARKLRRYEPDLTQGPLFEQLVRLDEGFFFGVIYMIRSERVRDHRFLTNFSHCEDLIFFLTVAHCENVRYGAVQDVVYEYRVHDASAMANLDGLETGYLKLIRYCRLLPEIEIGLRVSQARRVRSILVKSWLKRFRLDRAILAVIRLRNEMQGIGQP